MKNKIWSWLGGFLCGQWIMMIILFSKVKNDTVIGLANLDNYPKFKLIFGLVFAVGVTLYGLFYNEDI